MFKVIFIPLLLLLTSIASAKDYEIFDGRVYNGKFYPQIDVITWNQKKGDPYTQHFNVYWKGHPFDMSFKLEEGGAQKILLVRYNFKERNESLCRRVPAPSNFSANFKVYKDTTDKDMDKTILSMDSIAKKEGLTEITPAPYEACPEDKEEPTNALGADPSDPESFKVKPEKKAAPIETKGPQTEQEKLNNQYNFFN
ncbi:MAG: hypothetical protein ACOYL6_17765 [Bacteriovoracaceae bacterium]